MKVHATARLADLKGYLERDESMTGTFPDLTKEWDEDKLRNWMVNAKRLGRDECYPRAIGKIRYWGERGKTLGVGGRNEFILFGSANQRNPDSFGRAALVTAEWQMLYFREAN